MTTRLLRNGLVFSFSGIICLLGKEREEKCGIVHLSNVPEILSEYQGGNLGGTKTTILKINRMDTMVYMDHIFDRRFLLLSILFFDVLLRKFQDCFAAN